MRYCTKCVMPDTRPGIFFDEEGVCQACRAEEKKESTDWDARFKELEELCNKYRRKDDSEYDCIIAVSGGKDSHYQVYVFKELLNMNPLLVSVEDNFEMTEAGKHNIKNISERFGCHIISLKPNLRAQKQIMRKTFEKYGKPTWYIDRLIYTFPLNIASKFNIPLIVYGENISYEYGGAQRVETYSAKDQINNGVASGIDFEELIDENISLMDLSMCNPPSGEKIQELEPIYLSYFVRWNSYANYIFAKKNGFKDLTHEWNREHTFENFDQVDSYAYLVHPWLKYPKFGHASATDYASKFIRYGLISREEGIDLVKKFDHRVDQKAVQSFIEFLGYSQTEFYQIIDKFYNKDIFNKNLFGEWNLKESL
ncbi:N-acetyl sugar amidotransferase [Neobacillus sp.]|uniref:N-acetyl sugar amidotransferase n=1 Tax=Neobacillus sp. TaxID=2675273 RepID=UPI0028A10EA4|nr:N-acetyl sugar amidotransferase [Neobacillus sp.]